jgi:hypothetical protein
MDQQYLRKYFERNEPQDALLAAANFAGSQNVIVTDILISEQEVEGYVVWVVVVYYRNK